MKNSLAIAVLYFCVLVAAYLFGDWRILWFWLIAILFI